MTLATLQHLRTFTEGQHPVDLEPGQIAFNLSQENFDPAKNDYNTYIYVGNNSNQRIDEDGTVLVIEGSANRGWIRYRLRNLSVTGDTVYGDFNVAGARLKVFSQGNNLAELVVPKKVDTPSSGTSIGSVRWNESLSIFQAWDGSKWDTTSKVTVTPIAPVNPSNGDLWLSPGPPPILYVFVVPQSGPASWLVASSGGGDTALQPGNGVSANSLNQIDIIDQGPF